MHKSCIHIQKSMLKSQLSTLEVPVNGMVISINQYVSDICLSIIDNINMGAHAN
jgi:hypothetical protein